ncbi:MAG TPA: PIN domain-containing protein, partial [Pirellulaceae bacterium]|nr:PIN domain-containing protein [Pirellulaceae bacterium]
MIASARPKLFVLDTNVILHDSGSFLNFEEHDIAIPITVLEELDKFKRGNEDIHFQARQFLRRIDGLTGDAVSEQGASLGEGHGFIRIVLGGELDSRLKTSFSQDTPDHRILNTALALQKREHGRPVILVTKDTNLRMKAKSLGLPAQDYTSDQVENFDKLYTGKRIVEDIPGETISLFYANGGHVEQTQIPQV